MQRTSRPTCLGLRISFALCCGVLHAGLADGYQQESLVLTSIPTSIAAPNESHCVCCDLPYNPAPILVGIPVVLTSSSDSSLTLIREGYDYFFAFVNEARHGVCVGGERRRLEAVYVGSDPNEVVARNATLYLHSYYGVDLFLGPSADVLNREVAEQSEQFNAFFLAGLAWHPNTFNMQRYDGLFGLLSDPAVRLQTVLTQLQQSGATTIITVSPAQPASTADIVTRDTYDMLRDMCRLTHSGASAQYAMQLVEHVSAPSGGSVSGYQELLLGLPSADIFIGCLPYDHCVNLVQAAVNVDVNFNAWVLPECVVSADFPDLVGHAAQFIIGSTLWAEELPARSTFTGLGVAEFSALYSNVFERQPTHEVAIGYSVAASLASAIELANSTSPPAVAAAMRTGAWSTLYGPVDFPSSVSEKQLALSDKLFQRLGSVALEFVGSPSPALRTTADIKYPKPDWADHWCYMDQRTVTLSGVTYTSVWGIDSNIPVYTYNESDHDTAVEDSALSPARAAAATYYAAYVIGLSENLRWTAAEAAFKEASSMAVGADTIWCDVAESMRSISNLVFSTQDAWYQVIAAEAAVAHLRKAPSGGLNGSSLCSPCPVLKVAHRPLTASTTTCEACPEHFSAFTWTAGGAPSLDSVYRACIAGCSAGYSLNQTSGDCVPCPAGQFGSDGLFCHPCDSGFYTGSPGQESCLPCTNGRYGNVEGSSECISCDAGQDVLVGPWNEGIGCRNCTPGTFAPVAGTQRCALCAEGTAATGYGAQGCEECQAGKYSNWEATECLDCEVGKYQPQAGQGACLHGAAGADFNSLGLIRGENQNGVWVREEIPNIIEWQECVDVPSSCRREELCGEGSTGLHCNACLPGYVHTVLLDYDSACFQCPAVWWNSLALTAGFMAFLGLALALTRSASQAVRKPQALQVVLLKIFVQYTAFTNIIGFVIGAIIVKRRNLLGRLTVRVFSFGIMPLNIMGNMFFQVFETPVMSIRCLAQLLVDDSDIPVEDLERSTHASWFDDSLQDGWAALKAYQNSVETWAALFWFAFPACSAAALLVFAYLYVSWRFWRKQKFYRRAGEFYDMMFKNGAQDVRDAYDEAEWLVYVREYHYKLLGIWWPVAHFPVGQTQAGASTSCWRTFSNVDLRVFLVETKPVLLSIIVLGHGGVVFGCCSAMRCKRYGDGLRRIAMANMVTCPEASDALFWIAEAGIVIWGALAPIVLLFGVHKKKEAILIDERAKGEYSIIFNGYRHEHWGWELVPFLTETSFTVVLSLWFTPETMNKVALGMGLIYGAIHLICQPYDDRCEGLLTQVHQFFTATWILTCIIVEFVLSVDAFAEGTPTDADKMQAWIIGILCLLALAILHSVFLAQLWFRVYTRALDSHMAKVYSHVGPGHEKFEADLALLAEKGGIRSRIKEMMIRQYRTHRRSAPYVCLDPLFGWAVLCGSRGDHPEAPTIPRGRGFLQTGGRPLLSKCPKGPVDPETLPAKKAQKEALSRALTTCAEEVARKLATPTFSVSLMEFVLRAGFVLARAKEHHTHFEEELFEHMEPHAAEVDVLQAYDKTFSDAQHARKRLMQRVSSGSAAFMQFEPTGSDTAPELSELTPHEGRHVRTGWQRLLHKLEEEMWVGRKYWRHDKADTGHLGRTMSAASAASVNSGVPERTISAQLIGKVMSLLSTDQDGTNSLPTQKSSVTNFSMGSDMQFAYPGAAIAQQKSDDVMRKRLTHRTKQMFNHASFRRGVELEKLQIALMDLQNSSTFELIKWVDIFEERWVRHNEALAHKLDQYTGLLQDQQLQCDIEAEELDQLAAGSAAPPSRGPLQVVADDPEDREDQRAKRHAFVEALCGFEDDVLGQRKINVEFFSRIDLDQITEKKHAAVQTTINVAFPHYTMQHGHTSKASTHVVLQGAKAFSDATRARWVRLVLRAGKFDRPFFTLPMGQVKPLLKERREKQAQLLEAKLQEEMDMLVAEQESLRAVEAELQQLRDAGLVPASSGEHEPPPRPRTSRSSVGGRLPSPPDVFRRPDTPIISPV